MRNLIAAAAACVMLAGCGTQPSDLAGAQAGVLQFCKTDQPVVGAVATVAAAGVAVAAPEGAAAAPIVGLIVQDVNGVCAGLATVPVAAPPVGTQVVVPVGKEPGDLSSCGIPSKCSLDGAWPNPGD